MSLIRRLINKDQFQSYKQNPSIIVILLTVTIVSCGIFNEFLFGNDLLIFKDIGSDTFYNYYPIYYFITSNLSNFNLSFWSFNIGVGSSVLIFYQFLYDPFSVLFYFGGVDNISTLVVWVYLIKIFCAAFFSFLYFNYFKVSKFASIIGSLLFAFNGFLMGFGQHYFYATWVVFIPLILYSIEIWFISRKWLPIVLCSSYMILNIAIFWQVSIFVSFYVLFRTGFFLKEYTFVQRCWKLAILLGLVCLGFGLSAVFWLPEYFLLKASPRVGSDILDQIVNTFVNFKHLNTSDYYRSLVSRIFSNNLEGIGSDYKGFQNYYESIQLFVGIFPLLILPQFYIVSSNKEKLWVTIAILIVVGFLVFPGVSRIMNGFQYASYRWSYNIVIYELLMFVITLNLMLKKAKISISLLISSGYLILLIAVFLIIDSVHNKFITESYAFAKVFEVTSFLLIYSFLIKFLVYGKRKVLTFSILLLVICGELILEHRDSFSADRRSVLSKGMEVDINEHYFDFGNNAIQELKSIDKSVYRIEKNHWIHSMNDALIQDYYGLDSYNSLNSKAYWDLLNEFGYSANLNVIKWNSLDYPILADILSVKYHLTKTNMQNKSDMEHIGNFGDVSVFKRSTFLPFGFTYDSYILRSKFNLLTEIDKERVLLEAAVLDVDPLFKLKEIENVTHHVDDNEFRKRRREHIFSIVEFEGGKLRGQIKVSEKKMLFLSIPYENGWTAYVNGKKTPIHLVNFGFSGIQLEKGDSEVLLEYFPPYMKLGLYISIISLIILITLLRLTRRLSFFSRM